MSGAPSARMSSAGQNLTEDQIRQLALQDRYVRNREYMRNTIRKRAKMPQAAGGLLQQDIIAGGLLTFNAPTAQNAYAEGVIVRVEATVNPATGTSAAYALTPSAPFSLIDTLMIQYNGQHIRLRPYILRSLQMLQGYQQLPLPSQVITGQSNTLVQNYLSTGYPVVPNTNNVWTFQFYVPFNWLHPWDARGLLPVMGGETTLQVLIQMAGSPFGKDPVLNALYAGTGSGHAATMGGKVSCTLVYRDGDSYRSPERLGLDLSGIGTAQVNMDTSLPLAGIGVGTVARGRLTTMAQHYYIILTVIDGNQSSKYASWSNLQVIEFAKDAVGANIFTRFGTGTNVDIMEYLSDVRGFAVGGMGGIGQDLDEGIVPLLAGPTYGEPDASRNEGTMMLNTGVGGWNDVNYGIQFGTLGGVAGLSPRVEVHQFYINPTGLQLIG